MVIRERREGGDGSDVAAAQSVGVVFQDADTIAYVQRERFGGVRNSREHA